MQAGFVGGAMSVSLTLLKTLLKGAGFIGLKENSFKSILIVPQVQFSQQLILDYIKEIWCEKVQISKQGNNNTIQDLNFELFKMLD